MVELTISEINNAEGAARALVEVHEEERDQE